MRHLAATLATLASLALWACSGASGPTYPTGSTGSTNPPPAGQPASATTNAITVENNRFDPSATTVTAGTTVTWTWDACASDGYGTTCVDHSVTFDNGGPGSATQSSGSFSRQFATVGTYSYHCSVHASMTGQVIVR